MFRWILPALAGLCLVAPITASADALEALRRQAESGLATAQTELGLVYERGRNGVVPNFTIARQWYEKAAAQGDTQAEYQLGEVYYYGIGVSQDYTESSRWFRLAADKGHAWAQYYLGLLYAHGRGIAKNEKEAARWFSRAAKQGHDGARSNFFAFKYDRKWRNADGSLWRPDQEEN